MSHRAPRAFTLVELLVVIGIIAVLISILLPALSRVQTMGRTTKCLSNMRQIYMELQMYAQDFKGVFPPGKMNYAPTPPDTSTTIDWRKMLGDRINRKEGGPYQGTFKCPAATIDAGDFHYSGQPWLFPDKSGSATLPPPGGTPHFKRGIGTFAEMRKRSTEIVIVIDGNQTGDGNASAYFWDFGGITTHFDNSGDNATVVKIQDGDFPAFAGRRDIRWRHSGNVAPVGDLNNFTVSGPPKLRSNFLFGDGHAMTLRPGDLRRGNFRVSKRDR